MERRLLLLGLLRSQGMHGYMLYEVIDAHLGESVQLSRPTAYRLLDQMASEGWVSFKAEQEGARPPRRVYAITEEGEAAFQRLLRESLANYRAAEFPSQIALGFLDELSSSESLPLLRRRREAVEALVETIADQGEHPGSLQLILDHQLHQLAAELDWLNALIGKLESSRGNSPVARVDGS